MSAQPPSRRPHVTPLRDRDLAPRETPPSPPAESSPTSRASARIDSAVGQSEQRRVRRLRKAQDDNALPPAAIPIGLPVRIYVSWRILSGLIVVSLLIILYLFFSRDIFFIHEIRVGGTKYLTPPEIFERSGLANMHIFWVDPAQVAAKLEEDTSIANAQVTVGWPPDMVQIVITERSPAIIWEQSGLRVWVDVRGRVMAQRQDDPTLVRVVVEHPSKIVHVGDCPLQGMDQVLGPGSCIDPEIVAGAIQFKALYPNVTEMVYDPAKGLGYHDGRGWVLWFGDGTDIVVKMAVYNKIVDTALGQGLKLVEVNVSDPDAPYYVPAPSG